MGAIARWSHTLVLGAFVLGTAVLTRSDTERAPPVFRIVFLGRISADRDVAYQRLARELTTAPKQFHSQMRLDFVPALLERSWRIEEAAAEAIALKPNVILAPSTATARSVRRLQSGIPVVFVSFQDPVRSQVVDSTERRTEPMTGVWVADDLDAKRLEVLRDAYPGVRSVALLTDRPWARDRDIERRLPAHASSLGLRLTILYADDGDEARAVMGTPAAAGFDAWCLPPSGLAYLHTAMILTRLQQWKRPVITGDSADIAHGAPLSYGVDDSFRWPALVELLTRVLDGEPAGEIPIQRPQRYVLAVRSDAASGIPAPSLGVQRRADVIQR